VVSGVGYQARKENVGVKNGENRFLTLALNESTQSLEEIVVLGTAGAYRTEDFSPSLKIPTPLLETPQQVVSIGQQVIADQQLFNLQEVARNVSGVSNSGQFTPALDIDFSVRGFAANQYRNGLLIPAEDVSPDPVLIERVEFIKGPAGFFVGRGPGRRGQLRDQKARRCAAGQCQPHVRQFQHVSRQRGPGRFAARQRQAQLPAQRPGQEAGHYVRNASTDKYVVAPALRYASLTRPR
jgi:iron complex outermembrane receptor protein